MSVPQGHNVDREARNLIQEVNRIDFPAPPESGNKTINIVHLFASFEMFKDLPFPGKGARYDVTGQFIETIHKRMISYMDEYNPSDVFLLGGNTPDVDHIRTFLFIDGITPVEGSAELQQET